jgi:hypothetical protein
MKIPQCDKLLLKPTSPQIFNRNEQVADRTWTILHQETCSVVMGVVLLLDALSVV